MDNKIQKRIIKALNKPPRFHNRVYEKRATIAGIDICGYAGNPDECVSRFMEDLAQKLFGAGAFPDTHISKLPTNFHEFAMYYFDTVRKRKNVDQTHSSDMNRYKNHIKPRFEHFQLRFITPEHCQKLIDDLEERGIWKTSKEVFSLMNSIFTYAVDRGALTLNPMKTVVHLIKEGDHGHAFSLEEEKALFDKTYGTEYQMMFAVVLYTGMRPNEIKTASIIGNFLYVQNSKQKNAKTGDIKWKRIPICPMLAPFLEGVSEIDMYTDETMRGKIKQLFPNHILKDLRKTFYTRCETCKVEDKARDYFVGHSQGKRHDAYSELPDEYLIAEANKLSYPLEVKIARVFAPKKNRYGLAKARGKAPKPRFLPENR